MSASRKTPNFEKALAELEALVERMEEGDMSLEESLKAFENGIRLTQQCQQALSEAQQRVQMLMQKDGDIERLEFDAADEQFEEDGQEEPTDE